MVGIMLGPSESELETARTTLPMSPPIRVVDANQILQQIKGEFHLGDSGEASE
jgi:hypothetical protein